VSQQLPAVDPVSGEDVLVLISRFQAAAEQANRAAAWLAAGLAVVMAAAALAAQPVMLP